MMKKEEFLTKLRKNLSVLEEKEIQDIVEEYEQHIDMKMQGGLSEEAAIQDFGDLKELTAGILEAYHVKADYNTEKKNIDFEKVKEESKKATEKATNALGRGADALGKGAGAAGRWSVRQTKKMWSTVKKPFIRMRESLRTGKKNAGGQGFFGKLWFLTLSFFGMMWRFFAWCIRMCWNLWWCSVGIISGLFILDYIFLFGLFIVLLAMGYPLIGVIMVTVGGLMVSAAVAIFSFALLKKGKADKKNMTNDLDDGDSTAKNIPEKEEEWEYPQESNTKKLTVINAGAEVLNHA